MLALIGAGEYLPPIEPLDQALIARLPQPVRVVCLPTAAGTEGDDRIRYWMQLGVDHFQKLGVEVTAVPVTNATTANNPDYAAQIAAANFVYLSGGKPDYLYQSLAGSKTWQAIQQVLDGGGLLAGCSAGAMIMGEKFFGFPGWKSGFGLLPGTAVIPHFDEIPTALLSPMRLFSGKHTLVIGIDGDTALVKDGNQFEVLGSGGVTLWTRKESIRYTEGILPATALLP